MAKGGIPDSSSPGRAAPGPAVHSHGIGRASQFTPSGLMASPVHSSGRMGSPLGSRPKSWSQKRGGRPPFSSSGVGVEPWHGVFSGTSSQKGRLGSMSPSSGAGSRTGVDDTEACELNSWAAQACPLAAGVTNPAASADTRAQAPKSRNCIRSYLRGVG